MKVNHKVPKSCCKSASINSSVIYHLNLAVWNVLYLYNRITVAKILFVKLYLVFFLFDGLQNAPPPITLFTPTLSWQKGLLYSFFNVLKCGNNIRLITHNLFIITSNQGGIKVVKSLRWITESCSQEILKRTPCHSDDRWPSGWWMGMVWQLWNIRVYAQKSWLQSQYSKYKTFMKFV